MSEHPSGNDEIVEVAHLRATWLNDDPAVFRGCTMTEFVALGCLFIGSGSVLGLLLLLPFGNAIFGAGAGFIAGLGVTLLAAGALTRLKRNRPSGYHLQVAIIWLHRHGLHTCPFLLRTGVWLPARTPQ